MNGLFKIRVDFHNNTAYVQKDQLCSLITAFNRQNNTEIDWFGHFCADQGTNYIQFQGEDCDKTRSCAYFVCETINENGSLPLTYSTPNDNPPKAILH